MRHRDHYIIKAQASACARWEIQYQLPLNIKKQRINYRNTLNMITKVKQCPGFPNKEILKGADEFYTTIYKINIGPDELEFTSSDSYGNYVRDLKEKCTEEVFNQIITEGGFRFDPIFKIYIGIKNAALNFFF